ncbi:MAG: hypothetical protein ABJA83_00615 [Burkholderiaceae bacterium]
MRNRILVAAALTLVSCGAMAESVATRPSMEPATSPFTYEVLDATPSLRLKMPSPRTETPAVTRDEASAKGTDPKVVAKRADASAAVESRRHQSGDIN